MVSCSKAGKLKGKLREVKDLCKKEATDVASYLAVMNEAVSAQNGMKRNVSIGLSVVKGGNLGKRTAKKKRSSGSASSSYEDGKL